MIGDFPNCHSVVVFNDKLQQISHYPFISNFFFCISLQLRHLEQKLIFFFPYFRNSLPFYPSLCWSLSHTLQSHSNRQSQDKQEPKDYSVIFINIFFTFLPSNDVWLRKCFHETVSESPSGLTEELQFKLLTLWLIYFLNPWSSKQKLHVDMSSDMIIALNENHISREKLFPVPQKGFHVLRLMLQHIVDEKGKGETKVKIFCAYEGGTL